MRHPANLARTLVAVWLLVQPVAFGRVCAQADAKSADGPAVPLCKILETPSKYNGKRVVVSATYRVAFEASELYCLSCSASGVVWVDFDNSDGGEKAARAMSRLIHNHRGTVNGLFSGVFRDAGHDSYGHLAGWRYKISVDSVDELKLIDKLGASPQALPPATRLKVCP